MNFLLIAAGLAGLTGVAAGAFGAHALRDSLPPDMQAVWQTGALYHLLHAVALLGAAVLARDEAFARPAVWTGIAFAVGIVLFSGSLYLLALTGTRVLGAVTPLGGVAFMVGWALLIWTGWRAGHT
ncbi:hypothetical protein sos41_27850 [Alphaproteobacteria bacterium SO-S41]|nr:hypothetical protein sos41_27850 [Alphaproteobacteria bacterium SO-S41]